MARNGTKTGGRNFKPGKSGNPGGLTKDQAKAKHLTRETLKDLMSTLNSATHEEMEEILGNPNTTALTLMFVKAYMVAAETGDMRQIEMILQRLVGKVKDEIDVTLKPRVIRRPSGERVIFGTEKEDE